MAYEPSDLILQQRADLAKSLSAFRRVKPRYPFWQLAAHRLPTLWSLYRGLMREAPGEDIRWRIRVLFERFRSLTSPKATRQKLVQMHKYLDAFRAAKNGDEKVQRILARYNSMIAARREKAQMHHMIIKELAWQDRLRNRPILTGAYLRPTFFNRALPRLKPQPVAISMMIRKRRLARERRVERDEKLVALKDDMSREVGFETSLARISRTGFERVFSDREWSDGVSRELVRLYKSSALEKARSRSKYDPALLDQIKEARREKVRNKTREHERERRGEILKHTVARSLQGPPAHVLVRMSDKKKHVARVVRGVSEVGYVALAKKRMGRRLKDEETWKVLEEGSEERRTELDREDEAIRRVNEEKRRRTEGDE